MFIPTDKARAAERKYPGYISGERLRAFRCGFIDQLESNFTANVFPSVEVLHATPSSSGQRHAVSNSIGIVRVTWLEGCIPDSYIFDVFFEKTRGMAAVYGLQLKTITMGTLSKPPHVSGQAQPTFRFHGGVSYSVGVVKPYMGGTLARTYDGLEHWLKKMAVKPDACITGTQALLAL